MVNANIQYHPNPRRHADDIAVVFGSSQDSAIVYDSADDELTFQTTDAGGTLTDRLRIDGNSNTPTTYLDSTGGFDISCTNGIDYNPGSDIDMDIVTVGVTGTPVFSWDESEDAFSLSKGVRITSGVLQVGTPPTYSESNVSTDRTFDADLTTVDEVADVLGTLIADLRTIGLVD